MRRLVVALVIVVASLGVWWFASGSADGEAASAHESPASASTRVENTELAAEPETTTEPRDESLRETVDAPEVAVAPIAEEAPACAVFGTVVDSNGAPLANVEVSLSAYQRWSQDFEGPVIADDERFRGWKLVTGADGRFRFDTPPPDAQSIQALQVKPDPFHDSHVIRFGREGRAPLTEGEHDLGELRLADTGAIAGIVTDRAGRPLHQARTRIANDRTSTLQREATTDASGRYVIGHIKPGTYGVNCEHEGHLSEFRTPFEVVVGRTTDGVDFALGDSPSLSGRVVDVDGVPIADAYVWGWPQGSGKGAGSTTAADGSFTILLPQDEPYRLEAKFDRRDDTPAFEDRNHHAPNSRDIVIVLPRTVLVTLSVVDDSNGAPIERFGLDILRPLEDGRTRTMSPPQPTHRPGGTAQARVRPGIDRYHVVATGFQDNEGVFDASVAEAGRLEIRLGRGAAITGRALVEGRPEAGVTALLEPGRMIAMRGAAEKSFAPDSYSAPQTTHTDVEGRFRFDGVKVHMQHRLTLKTKSGTSLVKLVQSSRTQATDLGDLELQATGAIAGTVLTPPGRELAGLVVRLGDWRSGVMRTTDTEGAFRFDGVAAGEYSLFVDEASGRIASGAPFPVVVAPAETAHVELDLRDRGTCEVTLTVLFGGERIPGAHVELVFEGENERPHRLGQLDEHSRIKSWAPAFGPATIGIYTPDVGRWRHPTARLDLTLDARIDQVIEFEVASLAIVLPDSFTPPASGSVRVSLDADGQGRGHSANQEFTAADLRNRRVSFPRVPAGAFRAHVQVFDQDQGPVKVQTAPNSWTLRTEPVLEHTASITLVAGREYELRLP